MRYDVETGFYYLNSRYYDPETGRFINADGQLNGGALGYNLFAYCGNNPVNWTDPAGQDPITIVAVFAVCAISLICLASCSEPKSAPKKSSSKTDKKPNPNPSKDTSSSASSSIPEGGITKHKGSIRLCTDGSDGSLVPDNNYCPDTAYQHNGKPLDAYTVPYVVMPIGDTSAKLGDKALLINHDTGDSIVCVIGERGPASNGWGEVSIFAIWETGYPNHMTANHASGISSNYEIIIYPGEKYDWGD